MRIFFIVFLFVASTLLLPSFSDAAGLVPAACTDGQACQTCHFVELGTNIVSWLVTIMATLCALVVAFAGLKMVTAGGDPGAISEAREMITNVVIGFIILLSAWLVVDTVMKMFVKENIQGFGPWNEIKCADQPVAPPVTTPGTSGTPPIEAAPGACTTQCASIPSTIQVKSGACNGTCSVSSEIINQLTTLDASLDTANVNWRITEAYPPTRTHKDSCHQNGTCVDANCVGGCSASQVQTFLQSASNAGLRAVYEVKTQAQKDALVSSGVNAGSVSVLGDWISSPHFSVYKK